MGLGTTLVTLPGSGSTMGTDTDTGNVGGFGANAIFQPIKSMWGGSGAYNLTDKAGNELPVQMESRLIYAAASSFTRPANTTAYTQNAAVANSTTAGSVTPVSFTVSDVNNSPVTLIRCKVDTTTTGIAGIGFRLFLFNASPTALSGDNASFSVSKANCIGTMSGVFKTLSGTATGFSDGDLAWLTPDEGPYIITNPTSSAKTLFGLLQTLQAFTPSSAATFLLTLEGFQGRP